MLTFVNLLGIRLWGGQKKGYNAFESALIINEILKENAKIQNEEFMIAKEFFKNNILIIILII